MTRRLDFSDLSQRHALWQAILRMTIAIAKWWLEFVRNLIVVSVLVWLAGRSDLWYFVAIAYTSLAALILHAVASLFTLFSDIPAMQKPITRPVVIAVTIASSLIAGLAVFEGGKRLVYLVLEIARLQTR
jgi:hypothetical protein